MISILKEQGPSYAMEVSCPDCQRPAKCFAYENRETLQVLLIPVFRWTNLYICCELCRTHFPVTGQLMDLRGLNAHQLAERIRDTPSRAAQIFAIIGLLTSFTGFGGVIFGGLAAISSLKTKGWTLYLGGITAIASAIWTYISISQGT